MLPLKVWVVILISVHCKLVQSCPGGCQCNQPRTVFCLSRKNHNFPSRVPQNTINLYLFENGISSVEESSFNGLWDLQLLDLSHNQLSSLPGGVFKSLANLSNLDLSSNQLSEISDDTFQGLGRLERLYLNGNRIRSIHPDAFKGLENLLELKLRGNLLMEPPAFSLPQLLLLDLSYNAITSIQTGVFHATNIETLRLAGLGLNEVPEELFNGLKNLHELDLSENNLDRVPSGLRDLTKLNLAGNTGISQLQTDEFSSHPALQELDLSGLSLHTLPKGLFSSCPRLRSLSLAQNPFNCVCLLGWLAEWLRVSGVNLQRSDETRCHFPPKNAGKILRQLRDFEYGCPAPTTVLVPTTMTPSTTTPLPTTTMPSPKDEPTTSLTTTTLSDHPTEEDPIPTDQFSFKDQQCPPHTCLNDGICHLDHNGEVVCECPDGFYGVYCEMGTLTTAPVSIQPSLQLQILAVTGSSIQVDLQSYSRTKKHIRGIKLTLRNLSGSDRRPLIYSLPPALSEYTVRALAPNSTYKLCLGTLGEGGIDDELCTEAQTALESPQSSAHVNHTQDGNLTLVLVPAVAAGILLSIAVASAICYAKRRNRKGHAGEDAGPLEMEGVKKGLDGKGELKKLSESPVGPQRKGVESEEPLMDPTRLGNNNDHTIGRLPHSYF
ncbi:vasorin [Spea bombifrons]|uniref:vasorin n=1 Tax=Spea bombifrons TaxID=233779 RepID=UPI00234963E9|nr:vasorin [Spea bombifrons]